MNDNTEFSSDLDSSHCLLKFKRVDHHVIVPMLPTIFIKLAFLLLNNSHVE